MTTPFHPFGTCISLPLTIFLALSVPGCGGAEGGPQQAGEAPQSSEGGETAMADPHEAADPAVTDPSAAGNEEGQPDPAQPDHTDGGQASTDDPSAPEEGTSDGSAADAGSEPAVDPQLAWRQMVGRGRSVFRQTCDTCHPGGEADIGPNLRGIGFSVSRMTRQVRRGSGRMRPIPPARLPDRYMGDLMAYLSVLRAVRGVERP